MPIDLSAIPAIDNHCHGIYREQRPADINAWRELFTESRDPGMVSTHVATTLFYRRLMRTLASFLGCEDSEEAVLEARQQFGEEKLVRALLQSAHFAALCVDKGYPAAEAVYSDSALSELASCQIAPMLRVELLMQCLIVEQQTLSGLIEALRAALQDIRGQGYVALKSVVAYRTGLAIRHWDTDVVLASFAEARREAVEKGAVRLAHKPLLDTLLFVTFDEAAQQEVPIQFHVGYGDTDADMLLANPLHLRTVLEQRKYRSMPVVLLHECYPYTRQGAYLAAVYEHVYLDLSYGIPLLGYSEMLDFTRAALAVAPYSKLLYSSDGVGAPEIHWMSALDGRRILGQALDECIEHGELSTGEAEKAGRAILHDTAKRLYQL